MMDELKLSTFEMPKSGERITVRPDGTLNVPDHPVIPFIEGDGTGPDIWRASQMVFDAAVEKAYGGKRKIAWYQIFAGEKAFEMFKNWSPEDIYAVIDYFKVAIKGPLTTPIGGGFRSLNVTLRQRLDLFACIRPVRYFGGVPSPVKRPQDVDMVIFRENTEDVYAGIEWPAGSPEAGKVIQYLSSELGAKIRPESAIGIKPMSEFGSKRLIRMAIKYAIDNHKRNVTLVHKGNIMKYTEGAFKNWGYELAKAEFPGRTVTEEEVGTLYNGQVSDGKVVIKDRIADSMFQQILLRPSEYDVLALPNLNGDYMSDALAAQVGGLGMAPGANMNDTVAVFEATHGTAPKYAGQDKVNPGSVIISGAWMLTHLGWPEAEDLIMRAIERTIGDKFATYDIARQMEGATEVKCSEFARQIIARMGR